MKFKCEDIDWDIDANETMLVNLPSTVEIELDDMFVNSLSNASVRLADAAVEEELCEELSDKYGFCVKHFKYMKL